MIVNPSNLGNYMIADIEGEVGVQVDLFEPPWVQERLLI